MPVAEIQGDAAFSAFRAKLATVVTTARAVGKRIGMREGCCCPLGAHPDSVTTFPPSMSAHAHGWPEVSEENLMAFINGFGDTLGNHPVASPYSELGQLYRREAGII